jgi:hypothetical protein
MSVPSHGYKCRRVCCYPTQCPSCDTNVFYYQCSCGSKVFFETLGDWEVHECLPTTKRLRKDVFQDFKLSARTRKRILDQVHAPLTYPSWCDPRVSVDQLAKEFKVAPILIMNEAGRRGVKVTRPSDKLPVNVASWIRDYFRQKRRKPAAAKR